MSAKRYRNRTRRETVAAARKAATARGCICTPSVHVLHADHVQVWHAPQCPLAGYGTVYDVTPNPEVTP